MKNLLIHTFEKNKVYNFDWGVNIDYLIETVQEVTLGKGKIKDDMLEYINKHHNNSKRKIKDGKELISDEYFSDTDIKDIDLDQSTKEFIEAMEKLGHKRDGSEIPKYHVGSDMIKQAILVKKHLSKKLYGQDRAIDSVADSIKNNIIDNEKGPHATFLFLGPPATGKTYLAELISQKLEEYKVLKIDMTQYTGEKDSFGLFGLERGYGDARPGKLTSFVKENRKTIVVLDEFEKAHYNTQVGFLEIFNTGKKRDGCGWCIDSLDDALEPWSSDNKCSGDDFVDMVDFSETIFIITSNLGKELYTDSKFIKLMEDNQLLAESMIIDAIRREKRVNTENQLAIPPELMSRFSQSNIVLFNKLTFKTYETIANEAFREYQSMFSRKFGIDFVISKNFRNFLKLQLLTFAPELDARRIKSKIGVVFFDKITDHLMDIEASLDWCKTIKISISKEAGEFLKELISSDIENEELVRDLFRKNLTLKLKDKLTSNEGVITYKIVSCEFKRVEKIKDFSEDGLVFEIPDHSFNSVAGHKKAKERLKEVVNFLKDPSLVKRFDTQAPNGMLLYGPPGTGKTKLAKALANEADLPFLATTGVKLLDPDVRKNIFTKAKAYAPSIVFIDEIDTLGDRQNSGYMKSINDLLDKMDGFSTNPDEKVFIIAATNYKDRIDSALLRPGRIELHIKIDDLDKEARQYFLDDIIKTKPVSGKFDMDKLLMYTSRMTGAELELLGKEASIYCIRHNIPSISQEILIEQINTIKYGEKLTHLSVEQMINETAIHEAGHAIISKILMPHIKIEQVTVAPRGKALGFVSYDTEDSHNNMTKKDFKDRICVAMAGRVAQIKKYGEIDGMDTGATNDLKQATNYAYHAISVCGMDEDVGYINISDVKNGQYYEEKIDKAVEKWLGEAKILTETFVDKHWHRIEKLASLLLKQEVVYEGELNNIMNESIKNN